MSLLGGDKTNSNIWQLDKLPRHIKAAAPYPPANVMVHLHASLDSKSRQVVWSILNERKCGWGAFGYTFYRVCNCHSASVCISLRTDDWLGKHYGSSFRHLSLTDYNTKPAVQIILNKKNWEQVPEAAATSFDSLHEYRQYLVHHEIGHAVVGLNHLGEKMCWRRKSDHHQRGLMMSPIMLQQSRGTGNCLASSCVSDTLRMSSQAK